MNARGTGGSTARHIYTERARAVVMEDVDSEDARVYLPAHDDERWVALQHVRHFAELLAQEEGADNVN